MPRELYAYDGEHGTDPHAVVLELSDEDTARWQAVRDNERPSRWEFGTYVNVVDQKTGRRYAVATAPCGQQCHCAAVAKAID